MKKQSTRSVSCFKRWSRKGYGVFASLGREVKIGVLTGAMSILADPAVAHESDTTRTLELETVTVTALRGSAAARSLLGEQPSVDPLTLRFSPLSSIENALRLTPQVDLRSRGARGTQGDISIRGTSPDQAMVLLNGVNFSDARTGHQTHSLPLPMASIAAVDFIPLNQTIGAFGGALDYRTPSFIKNSLSAAISGGSYGTYNGTISTSIGNANSSVYAAASYDRSDGYVHNTDYSRMNLYLRATHRDSTLGTFDFQAGYQTAEFGANGFYSLAYPNQWEATSTVIGSIVWRKNFRDRFGINAMASYRMNSDRFDLFRPGTPNIPSWYTAPNNHLTDNVGASVWADYNWGVGGVTALGVDYTYNHIWSTVLGESIDERTIRGVRYTKADRRNSFSYYLSHKLQIGRWDAAAAASINSSPYGVRPLWGVSVGYSPIEGLRAGLAASGTMRLPTFTDLYYTTATHQGNKNLAPEHATTFNFDLGYKRGEWSALGSVYYRQGRDIIDWVRPVGSDIWNSEQITSINTFGVELSGAYRPLSGCLQSIVLSYSHIISDKSSSDRISKYALDYMRHKASATANFRITEKLILSVVGSYFDRNGVYEITVGKAESYKPYFLLDSRLSWSVSKVNMWVECTNILDRAYFDFGGLPLPGRWFMAGVGVNIF